MRTGDEVRIPERRTVSGSLAGNRLVQIDTLEDTATVGEPILDPLGRELGFALSLNGRRTAIATEKPYILDDYDRVLGYIPPQTVGTAGHLIWVGSSAKPIKPSADPRFKERLDAVRASWLGKVTLREEIRDGDGKLLTPGLRPPQIGGIFGVLSHWKGHDGVATVVMPTGTGKTETMLTLLVHERFRRLLVLVPSDSLREQIGRKFETLGRLRQLGVLAADTLNPVVGRLTKRFKTKDEATDYFCRCNVVISTVAVLTGLPNNVKAVLAESFDTLFIDEAHHVAARTWTDIKDLFSAKAGTRVVQFTATPFREDGKLVDGKVAFRFPMRKAMQQGYFTKIHFLPVDADEDSDVDAEIAAVTVRRLRADLANGRDHVVMARTKTIKRAVDVMAIYQKLAPEFAPCCVHNKLSKTLVAAAKASLFSRATRIIVCVDMLGEGFDFPNLKIAALHDPHRSIAVTLQFVGRFTRDDASAGEATAIACLADPRMDSRIQSLYAEDADWNVLLDTLSEGKSEAAAARSDFLDGFGTEEDDLVSLRHIFPKMSTIIFRTGSSGWRPQKMEDGLGSNRTVRMGPRLNPTYRCALAITEESQPVPWGSTKLVTNTLWNLFLIYWDDKQRLLFINTSDHSNSMKPLAEAVCGSDVQAVESEDVYKPFHGIQRMSLLNVGLKSRMSHFTRFRMLVGPDVAEGMSVTSLAGSSKTNVFVTGREGGRKVTLGASAKGRFWSYAVAYDMGEWVKWCQRLGQKVRDPSIKRETVLEGALIPTQIDQRPDVIPFAVEWSDDILARSEDTVTLDFGSGDVPILDVSLEPVINRKEDPLQFNVVINGDVRTFEVVFHKIDIGVKFVQLTGSPIHFRVRQRSYRLTDWFGEHPPCFLFADLSELEGNFLFRTRNPILPKPMPDKQIQPWAWPANVDIRKESHRRHLGMPYIPVQKHVFDEMQTTAWSASSGFSYDIIFDDDGSGEAADIVALGTTATEIRIDLFHCKYSGAATASARVGDLYEVCGQSARSVRWITSAPKLVSHLVKREIDAIRSGAITRFIVGDRRLLRRYEQTIGERKVIFRVFAVQPGLSKAEVATAVNINEILASVETYLRQCVEIGLQVICSA